ncbi:MAG: DUF5063 domain-containing protein [Bacteroidaceae bacterium]|jgi:hypothetical protein|nr:DUF5063 domain-containing protein [Bacteroidaceae bacterium]
MNNDNNSSVYERDILELVTVAVEFCAYVENAAEKDRKIFISTMQKLLPLLYLKGVLAPKYELTEECDADSLSSFVSMENYDIVRNNVAFVMGEYDSFLDVFVEDMKYSDTPILSSVSENIADIYQDLKNFVCAYKDGTEEMRYDAIVMCKSNFENYWGQRLVNVLRALHEINYGERINEDEDY